jgi:AraC family transcriptional regulator
LSTARRNGQPEETLGPGQFYGQVLHKYARDGIILSEFKHERARKLPRHSHELAFFNLLLDGQYSETFLGKTAVLKPLGTIFHPADTSHHDEIGPSGIRIFSVELVNEWSNRIHECSLVPESSVHLPASELSWLAARLYREYREHDCCSALAVEGLVLEMLAIVARAQTFHERRPPAWLPNLLDLLNAGFHRNLTINDIAAEVGLHPIYLSRVFRQFRRQTIGDYLHKLRVQFACEQLKNSELSLSTIAASAGFSDQSHFTRVFKRLTGLTPGAFRTFVIKDSAARNLATPPAP